MDETRKSKDREGMGRMVSDVSERWERVHDRLAPVGRTRDAVKRLQVQIIQSAKQKLQREGMVEVVVGSSVEIMQSTISLGRWVSDEISSSEENILD
jgi:uncharacterized protein YjeT (DUF2065 family)